MIFYNNRPDICKIGAKKFYYEDNQVVSSIYSS